MRLLDVYKRQDKGDYDYHDVNTMEIVIPETKLRMPKEEAVEVSIMPQMCIRDSFHIADQAIIFLAFFFILEFQRTENIHSS